MWRRCAPLLSAAVAGAAVAHCAIPAPPAAAASTTSTSRAPANPPPSPPSPPSPSHRTVRAELSKYRAGEAALRAKWIRDELGWNKLPARAWPPHQPDAEDVPALRARLDAHACRDGSPANAAAFGSALCLKTTFDLATALLFNALDPPGAVGLYRDLAARGHADAEVALGIVLVEGLGVDAAEEEGVQRLRAAAASGHAQGQYELATALYTGVEGVLEVDEEAAFALFETAAKSTRHMGALYMVADCLLEGIGTRPDPPRAVDLLHGAAVQGHRSARGRLLQLLDSDLIDLKAAAVEQASSGAAVVKAEPAE